MERYKILGDNSGIVAYELGEDWIKIQFRDGGLYLYDYKNTGSDLIEQMKELAIAGQGLNSFVSRFVKRQCALKLR